MLTAARSNLLAVGADRHAPDFIVVPGEGQRFLALVILEWRRVPDADGPIRAGRGEPPAVRAERHAPAHVGVSAEAEHLPAGRRVPDVHRLVFAGRGEAPAVRAEGDAQNESAMRQRVEELAGRRIPHVHAAVEAGRGQPPAVRAERQRAGDMRVSPDSGKVRSGSPPASASQSFTLPHQLPDARRRPSRLNATLIACLCVSGEGVQELIGSSSPRPSPRRHFPPRVARPSGLNATVYAVPLL